MEAKILLTRFIKFTHLVLPSIHCQVFQSLLSFEFYCPSNLFVTRANANFEQRPFLVSISRFTLISYCGPLYV